MPSSQPCNFRATIQTTKAPDGRIASHTLVLTAPFLDVFLNWRHISTPFSLRTLISRGIDLGCLAMPSNNVDAMFNEFGTVLKRLVKLVVDSPQRFVAKWVIETRDLSIMTFYEVVLGYRLVKLVELEMRPSLWDDVISDTGADLERIQKERVELKARLVHVIGIIARHSPYLLLSGPGADAVDPAKVDQPQSWSRIVQEYLSTHGNHNEMSDTTRKKAFVMFTGASNIDVQGTPRTNLIP
jgi:hypothetical protein